MTVKIKTALVFNWPKFLGLKSIPSSFFPVLFTIHIFKIIFHMEAACAPHITVGYYHNLKRSICLKNWLSECPLVNKYESKCQSLMSCLCVSPATNCPRWAPPKAHSCSSHPQLSRNKCKIISRLHIKSSFSPPVENHCIRETVKIHCGK